MRPQRISKTCLAVTAGLVFCNACIVRADYGFGRPTNLGPEVNSSSYDIGPTVSQDELTIIFNSPAASYTEEVPYSWQPELAQTTRLVRP